MSELTAQSPKPTLLLVRHPLTGAELQCLWEEAYYKAFRYSFDLVVVEEDCDLDRVCDKARPDLIAFRGAYSAPHRRIKVERALSHGGIPRVGLYFGDGFCTTRPAFFYDMERWGVDTYFTQTFYLAEHTPEVAARTFVLPQTFDEDLFHDYGEEKSMPFVVFGKFERWRHWRNETAAALMKHYPTMICPHPGYSATASTGVSWVGEPYARALSRGQFSICDGSIFNCVLRKHVEIPACGTVLISQPIDGLREYGYVDMENCVIGEGDALMAKIAALMREPDRLRAIAAAGCNLAHSRHASRHCDQLYRWFLCQRHVRPGEAIIQHGTFGAFEIVADGRSGAIPAMPTQPNEIATLLQEAQENYAHGVFSICQKKLKRILELKGEFAPARFLLVRALLRADQAREAALHGRFLFKFARQADQAPEPDPVEWAWWVIIQLCQGDLKGAKTAMDAYPGLHHLELRRAAWLVERLQGRDIPMPEGRRKDDRPSVAVSLAPSTQIWLDDVDAMLRSCARSLTAATGSTAVLTAMASNGGRS